MVALSLQALAGPLNDTGIDFCRDHATGIDTPVTASTTCTAAHGGQDARYGRDPAAQRGALTKVGGGSKGFDFTKVCNSGHRAGQGTCPADPPLGSGPNEWACTYDNNTGLLWEVKTDDGGLRDKDWTYTWYDSIHSYGGNPGTASGGVCLTAGRCDTEKFVADVNVSGLCGHNDWRMPTVDELSSLADLGIAWPGPTIDATYFPNTPSESWSGTPVASISDIAWVVGFSSGVVGWNGRLNAFAVRVLRTGQ